MTLTDLVRYLVLLKYNNKSANQSETSLIIGTIFVTLTFVCVVYLNSPLKMAERMIIVGERCICEREYEKAVMYFERAYETHSSSEIVSSIVENIDYLQSFAESEDDSTQKERIYRAINEIKKECSIP